jgi:hypothetical protein
MAAETTVNFRILDFSDIKTYWLAALFIVGNILLPQLCHLIPNGGFILLPIYFFTLVGAYRYGWKAGLLVALASPLLNSLLFGMPAVAVLPAILIKSVLLAVAAGWAAAYFKRVSMPVLALVVAFYQLAGTLGEWMLTHNFMIAIQDFRLAIPGMLLQVIGGYFVIRAISR